jgi:hypothetical protein
VKAVKRWLAAAALAAGCATTQTVIGPDGQPALLVRCPRNDSYRCTARAYRVCPGGFQVLDDGNRLGTMITTNGYEIPNQMVFHGYIVLRCR